jgi:hypothetical protein
LRFLHTIDCGGAAGRAFPLWADLKVSLQRFKIRRSIGEGPGGGKRKPKAPAYVRLTLHRSSDGSDHAADLDGKSIRVRGESAYKMLDVLQKKKGERVKAVVLHSEIAQRPDRVLNLLDKRLQRIIDPPKNGVGYAML